MILCAAFTSIGLKVRVLIDYCFPCTLLINLFYPSIVFVLWTPQEFSYTQQKRLIQTKISTLIRSLRNLYQIDLAVECSPRGFWVFLKQAVQSNPENLTKCISGFYSIKVIRQSTSISPNPAASPHEHKTRTHVSCSFHESSPHLFVKMILHRSIEQHHAVQSFPMPLQIPQPHPAVFANRLITFCFFQRKVRARKKQPRTK